jgi:hypothetical protein
MRSRVLVTALATAAAGLAPVTLPAAPARAHDVIDPADYQQVELAKGVADMGEPMSLAVLPDRSVLHTYDAIAGATAPGWEGAGEYAAANGLVWAPSVGPGYVDDRAVPGNTTPTLGYGVPRPHAVPDRTDATGRLAAGPGQRAVRRGRERRRRTADREPHRRLTRRQTSCFSGRFVGEVRPSTGVIGCINGRSRTRALSACTLSGRHRMSR